MFITGYAKLPSGITATELYSVIAVALVVNRNTGEIIKMDCTLATETGRGFVKDIIIGKNISDLTSILEDIYDNYFGSAKKALVSALKQCHEKYKLLESGKEDVE